MVADPDCYLTLRSAPSLRAHPPGAGQRPFQHRTGLTVLPRVTDRLSYQSEFGAGSCRRHHERSMAELRPASSRMAAGRCDDPCQTGHPLVGWSGPFSTGCKRLQSDHSAAASTLGLPRTRHRPCRHHLDLNLKVGVRTSEPERRFLHRVRPVSDARTVVQPSPCEYRRSW